MKGTLSHIHVNPVEGGVRPFYAWSGVPGLGDFCFLLSEKQRHKINLYARCYLTMLITS